MGPCQQGTSPALCPHQGAALCWPSSQPSLAVLSQLCLLLLGALLLCGAQSLPASSACCHVAAGKMGADAEMLVHCLPPGKVALVVLNVYSLIGSRTEHQL